VERVPARLIVFAALAAAAARTADVPTAASWVWYPENPAVDCIRQTRYLRRTFRVASPVKSARLRVMCDDSFRLRVNGAPAPKPLETGPAGALYELSRVLDVGDNVLAFEVYNAVGRGGLLVTGVIREQDGTVLRIRSDRTFRASKTAPEGWDRPGFDDSKWPEAGVVDSAFGEPWFSHPAFDVRPFLEPGDWERWNAWRAKILAVPESLETEKHARAKFAFLNGSCALVIDGVARPAFIYRGTVDPLSKHGRRQIGLFRDAGVHVYTAYMPLAGCRPEPGVFRFDRLDDVVRGYLSADPDAYLILILRLVPPDWWMDAHPEELVRYAAGEDFNTTDECGRVRRPSLASNRWRNDMLALWRAAIRHLESRPWGKRVIGYQPGYGIYTEWHYFGSWSNQMPDTGPAMTAAFREWLRKNYGSVARLRAAWGRPDATFENATVPGVKARLDAGALGLRRPGADRWVMDYYRCQQEITAQDIETFCAAAKETTGGRVLCGAFYGYFYGVPPQTQGGHLELERLLRSPYIDYFAAPYDYSHRLMGDDGRPRSIVDAFQAAGKVHLIEADTRTYLHPRNEHGRLATREQSIAAIRREVAAALVHGCALWWCDFGADGAGGWYDDPALIGEIERLMHLAAGRLKHPQKRVSRVALICDLRSCYWLGDGAAMRVHYALLDRVTTELYHTGAPFDTLLLSQLGTRIPVEKYRLLIFLNTLEVSPEQRRVVADAVRGRSVLWLWAPGITDGRRLDPDLVRALTGFRVTLHGDGEPVGTVECTGKHPLTAGIPAAMAYSLAVHKAIPVPEYRDPKQWYNPRSAETMRQYYAKFAWSVEGARFVWTFATTRDWTDIHLQAAIPECDGLRIPVSGGGAAAGAALRVVVKGADGGEFVSPSMNVPGQPETKILCFAGFSKAPWYHGPASRIAFPLKGLKLVLNGVGSNREGELRVDGIEALRGSVIRRRVAQYGSPVPLVPVLTIDDPEATPLGHAPATGNVVLACKGPPGVRRVLSTVPFVPRQLLAALMDEAGVSRYVSSERVIVRADSGLVCLHTAEGGRCPVHLSSGGGLRDALSGRTVGYGPVVKIDLQPDTTVLLESLHDSGR